VGLSLSLCEAFMAEEQLNCDEAGQALAGMSGPSPARPTSQLQRTEMHGPACVWCSSYSADSGVVS
jgi:hypothetical protein